MFKGEKCCLIFPFIIINVNLKKEKRKPRPPVGRRDSNYLASGVPESLVEQCTFLDRARDHHNGDGQQAGDEATDHNFGEEPASGRELGQLVAMALPVVESDGVGGVNQPKRGKEGVQETEHWRLQSLGGSDIQISIL